MPKFSKLPSTISDDFQNIEAGALEAVPIDLHVDKLNYTVTSTPGSWWEKLTNVQMPWEWMEGAVTTQVLKDVSFTARSGQLVAIMGGSGSGKTSLLDVMAHRTNTGVSGRMYLNSVESSKSIIDSCSGYVRQDDRLISFLTVRETLMFVARLKMPKTCTRFEIRQRVERVIDELGLKHAADTKVGDATVRGLSGGEKRRVSIGIQLIIMPSLLFLDEPTSGLDSFTANTIVQTLSRLTHKKRTIIMSIHQPRFEIFNAVDVVMILSRGRIVYEGATKDMVGYFTTLGFPCPEQINPCDFYIDLVTVDCTNPQKEETSTQIVDGLLDAYQATTHASHAVPSAKEVVTANQFQQSVDSGITHFPSTATDDQRKRLQSMLQVVEQNKNSPGIVTQCGILTKRCIRVTVEDYLVFVVNMIQALFMSVLLGAVYVNLELTQVSIRDWFGLMFMMSVMYPYLVILAQIGNCHEERRFLYFELQDKMYHPAAYYVAKLICELPLHLIYVLTYCIPVYAMAGLKYDVYTSFMFFLFVSFSVYVSRMMAMASAAVFPTFQISCVVAQMMFSLFYQCGGFLININNILTETKWISYASYLRWGYEALCINQIKDLTFKCPQENVPCVHTGDKALEQFGFDGSNLGACATGLCVSLVVFMMLTYVGIRYIPQKPRNE